MIDSEARSYQFALRVISLMDNLPKDVSTQVIAKQLLRAATSIGANIIEAKAGSSRRDFINFFNHSLKSANETKYWLRLLKDSGKTNGEDIGNLLKEADVLANILGASILTLKKTKL